ncbi:M48 family metallopeptidase [Ectothiorhodospira sp. PHS-1]|uniref:M48 metallopeptidase family protein n=1 Tax=Ectothiorhodospira sp. PHS-1 TaxID=519989 RepID=UPI001FED2B6A|nr:M48 family metallopeptidase [Ectothiorhodospira sp. PHS-1]
MMKAGGAAYRDSRARRRTGPGKGALYPAQELKRRAMAWAVTLRVNPKVIRVQEMRRKWGSCSSAGTVTLASDLVEQEERFQDYVIVHELLHLRFSTHGRMFKALMSAHVPGWREFEMLRHAGKMNAPQVRV